jgi:putative transposase
MRRTFKYRIFPSKPQERSLALSLETCRRVYNNFLWDRKNVHETTGESLSYFEQKRQLPLIKANDPLIPMVHSQVLQDVCKRVDLAFQAFFRRVKAGEDPGYPRFKGQGQYDSLTYSQFGNGVRIENGKLWLSKIGSVKIKLHRPLDGECKTVVIRRTVRGKWFASFSCEVDFEPLPESDESVGIDVGLKTFATLSTGEQIANPRFYRKEEKALAKAQRKLSSDPKGSAERRKRKKTVARVHERITGKRENFVFQLANQIVQRFGKIYVEKLDIKEMVSKNYRGMNKSIADAAWGMFRQVLESKAESAGREYGDKEPAYTSQDCCVCGHRMKMPLSKRIYECPKCGNVKDRDHNSALNILSMGLHGVAGMNGIEAPAFRRGE